MATIVNYITLRDGMSAPLARIASASRKLSDRLDRLTGSTDAVGAASARAASRFGGFGRMLAGGLLAGGALAAVHAVGQAIGTVASSAEEFAGIQARLGLVTDSQDDVARLNQMIYESALRARGGFMDMAGAVSKLALNARDAFPDPEQAVGFMEGVQKLFTIGGASASEQANAMLQLTQALGSGRLQGDEFRSISENAPTLLNMISKELGVTRGEVKALAAEGAITSDVIKRAVLRNMDDIDAQFAKVPKRWGDHFNNISTRATVAFAPVFGAITKLANSPAVQTLVDNLATGIQRIAPFFMAGVGALRWFVEVTAAGLTRVNRFFEEHSTIARAALVGLGLLLAHAAGMAAVFGARMLGAAVMLGVKTAADWANTAAMIAATYAQYGLNAALYACPVTWIVGAVVGLIAVFYGAVAAVNHFAGASISATGLIFGAFAWLFSNVFNFVARAWNIFAAIANFWGEVWADPTAAAYNFFARMWNEIVGLTAAGVNNAIDLINHLPGINFDHVDGGSFKADIKEVKGALWNVGALDYANGGEWAAAGYQMGAGLADAAAGLLNPSLDFGVSGDPRASATDEEIAGNTAEGARQGKRAADALDSTASDLKYLRDAAEREAINRYVNATIKVDAGGLHVTNGGGRNFDGVMREFCDHIAEAIETGTEGVLA